MKKICEQTFDSERALYALEDAEVTRCVFAGEADGESPLKETRGLSVGECEFGLRYALWHSRFSSVTDSKFLETCRAPLWYCSDIRISGCSFEGVKALRECDRVSVKYSEAVSDEFGWKCRGVEAVSLRLESDYAFFDSSDITAERLSLKGKYSFQYAANSEIRLSSLMTKDAFWHSKNVTVMDSTIIGEYLGWYSENLRLVNCTISGTQPFCYCKGLVLENCTLKGCDLAFENSEVSATLNGSVDSVKNPLAGKILADSYGEIIIDTEAAKNGSCEIASRSKEQLDDIKRVSEMMCVYASPEYFAGLENKRGLANADGSVPENGKNALRPSMTLVYAGPRIPRRPMSRVYAGPEVSGPADTVKKPDFFCKNCGASNDPSKKYCCECGAPLNSTEEKPGDVNGAAGAGENARKPFCSACGTPYSPGAKFCKECGAPLYGGDKTNL